jgi:hypothetical protein
VTRGYVETKRAPVTAEVQDDPDVFITRQGVFTGPDPVADKVRQAGDVYEGVTVSSVTTGGEALNDRGRSS